MKFDQSTYKISDADSFGKNALYAGLGGAALCVIGYFVDSQQFFYSYLTAFVFWTTIALGGMFFSMLHHLVNATWSVVLRRLSENVMMTLPFMALLVIPLFFGLNDLYHWSDPEIMAADHLLQKKAGYLNDTFFVIRIVVYFSVFTFVSLSLYRASVSQDSGKEGSLAKMRRISAFGMILFALTITYFSFDLLMSLDAHWYSTIYGVYVFGGSLLSFLAFLILFGQDLNRREILKETITIEHYHDLSRLIFTFVIFWSYIAFSQYLVIWYGNIPEETIWYLHRWEGSWKYFSLTLLFGHFIIPFLLLMTHSFKRNMVYVKGLCGWLLLMHFVDIYWLVMPSLHKHGAHVSWMDVAAMVGVGGFFLWFLASRFKKAAIIPVNDPKLEASINHNRI